MEILHTYVWQIISFLEFLIIFFLVISLIRSSRKKIDAHESKEILKFKRNNYQMTDLVKDIHLSKELYKSLSRISHPDRYVGTNLLNKATELFQLVQKAQSNYNELKTLEKRINSELITVS